MSEHRCREHLPKPRRRRLGQVRACPCGRLYACHVWGILAPTPMWLAVFSDNFIATARPETESAKEAS